MKKTSMLTCAAGALLLASCGKEENAAGVSGNMTLESPLVVPANDGVDRPMFNDAQKHLRFGGDYYAYTYVGDSYSEIADFVDEFVVVPFLKEPMAEEGVDVDSRRLLDWSGLSGVTAMGGSSHSMGDVYEIRQVVVVDDMTKGIWQFMGEARPSLSANVFAGDVSIAMDMQSDLRKMRAWIDELKPMLGEEFSAMLDESMNQGVGKKTVGEILDGLDARLALGVVLHADKKVMIPLGEEEKLELPDVDIIICAEGLTENFDELRSMISSQAMFEKVELPNGMTGYAVKAEEIPPQLPLENVRPVIAYDEANNRIFVCSRLSYLEETLSSAEKLKDEAEYRLAMEGLPSEVLSTLYFSKQAGGEIDNLLKRLGDNNEQTLEGVVAMALAETESEIPGFTSDKALEMMNKLGDWKTKFLGNAWLSVSSRDENTIYSVTRMPINGRPLMLGGSGVTSLVAMSSVSTMFIGAKAWKEGADRANCILNIRNVQVAVRSWQNMNGKNIGDPIMMSELVGDGKFLQQMPVCPLGGEYTFSETIPEVGNTVLSCSEHDHAPSDTTGW